MKNETISHLEWAYDFCPSRYSWMAMFGLVLYLAFFAPGIIPKKTIFGLENVVKKFEAGRRKKIRKCFVVQ